MILFGVFIFLVGACVGSFLNVVIWRLPNRGQEVLYLGQRGRITLSWPPSHCPMCDKPIEWYRNIPVMSWVLLRGRCADCHAGIPVRYPLVELGTAGMFLGFYLAYFVAGWQPGIGAWPAANLQTDWPPFVLHLVLASALLAASAIDADLFIIPLAIPWFLAIFGVVACGLIGPPLPGKSFAIVPHLGDPLVMGNVWWLAKPILGMTAGLLLANLLMALKIMPRSFDEHDHGTDHEKPSATGDALYQAGTQGTDTTVLEYHKGKVAPMAPPPKLTRYWPAVVAAILVLGLVVLSWGLLEPKMAALITISGFILIFLLGVLPRDEGQVDVTDEVMEEITSPQVRQEMLKELLFLAIPLVGGVLAYWLPLDVPREAWLGRVLGSLLGLLVGGGVVWFIRVTCSLAFGKEAMGMGDAHLMAGVGAVIGAPLVVAAFFTAPFLGLVWAIFLKFMGKPNVLPYGPWLSVASILMLLLGNPIIRFFFHM